MPVDINLPDIVYYSTLILCISLGSHYRKITDTDMKRNYGTGLGILISYLICGYKIYHCILMIWGNIIIVKCCDKRYIHQMSLAYTWIYLAYTNLNTDLEGVRYEIWILQMIALRLVGLAFEIHLASKLEAVLKAGGKPSTDLYELPSGNLTAVDIIAYSFHFIGLHKGPYYRWKVFQDHFSTPFGVLGDFRVITEQKLKKVLACGTLYFILRTNYPLQLYYNPAFYTEYGTDNRYLYNLPQLVMFCLQYQVIMMLCTSVCTESGFGVYPARCVSMPGQGPTVRKSLLKLTKDSKIPTDEEYNFGMLKCFGIDKLLFGPRMRDTLKSWDISKRYWFWAYPYKNVIRANKIVRSAFSYLIWALWCGPKIQYLIVMCTLWIHINLEDEFVQIYDTSGAMTTSWDIGFSIMRLLCLIYLTPCFIIPEQDVIVKYYNSIYWVFHIVLIVLLIFAVAVQNSTKTTEIATQS